MRKARVILTDFPVKYDDMIMLESSPPLTCNTPEKWKMKSELILRLASFRLDDTYNQSIVQGTCYTHNSSDVQPLRERRETERHVDVNKSLRASLSHS